MIKSQALRDSARLQRCTLRFPGCNYNPETTVLAHVPCGMRGMGIKGPDNIAVFSCAACHDVLDRSGNAAIDWQQVVRAIAETQTEWIRTGLMKIQGHQP